jgi:formiminotetrahydrofolate cyclodeaminase
VSAPDYVSLPVRELMDELAAETPAPAGGTAAAVAVGLGAALLAMSARFAVPRWDGAGALAARAEGLRAAVEPLAREDADAFAAVLAAIRSPREEPGRAERIAAALSAAADVPFRIAEAAAEVADGAAEVAVRGNPNLCGDAAAAALLAEAGARAAANLVAINLAEDGDDERPARARELAERASTAAARAVASCR